ncbi:MULTISPECIES: LolA-related protein [unclassified Saccharibacter]|uniref:LolA-related protein n=1 Tax=unclassified Saccharibacter TaxID=2648722 RepID=UPI001320A60B|nr:MULTISPECIES: LolA-related protein [unclassified Saccharibacter]MXV36877.1 outer membrane lipoprotein carrier protein LolA [Saccharibacter sp. EH611]MXV58633.1 outer membrane lipoprotein carrier protein LolA [Saccharibacter sp. EH70]MXV66139.1 outer membrane lipoprotein carrier protein LolA [Saccharibacter sp. EH60]
MSWLHSPHALLTFLLPLSLTLPSPAQAEAASTTPSSPPPASTPSLTPQESLAETILSHLGQVSERDNHFRETHSVHALKAPLKSSGILRFRAPDHIEKITTAPIHDTLIMEGDVVQIHHGKGPARTLPLHVTPVLELMAATIRGPLQGNTALLKQFYSLSAQGDIASWTLTMTPRTSEVAHMVHIVQMTGHNNAIESIHLIQANNDVTDTIITR